MIIRKDNNDDYLFSAYSQAHKLKAQHFHISDAQNSVEPATGINKPT